MILEAHGSVNQMTELIRRDEKAYRRPSQGCLANLAMRAVIVALCDDPVVALKREWRRLSSVHRVASNCSIAAAARRGISVSGMRAMSAKVMP